MATKKKDEQGTEQVEETKSQKLGRVRNEAVKAIIAENKERFHQLMVDGAQAEGVEWKPRPTEQERARAKEEAEQAKAQKKLDALLAQYPGLAETFAPVAAENQVDQDEDGIHATV